VTRRGDSRRNDRHHRDDGYAREDQRAPASMRRPRFGRWHDNRDVVGVDLIRRDEIDDLGVAFVVRPHDVPRTFPARAHHRPTSNRSVYTLPVG